jgi:hypothetical protein
MCYGITNNKEDIDNSVQELMLYFMQMNPDTLKTIWEKDGKQGIIRYGAVVLKRALTSPRSPFYYKYQKYYTHIDSFRNTTTNTVSDTDLAGNGNYYKDLSNIPNEEVDYQWTKLEEIDKELDKLDSWYDKKIFQLYYSGETLDSLAAKTRISRNSLFTTIDKVRTIIKKELVDD